MNQALAVLEHLSSRVHDCFADALQGTEHSGTLQALRAFASAVDWKEPLVLSLLASHALLLTLAVTTQRNQSIQIAILALCFTLVRGGEKLNGLAGRKWSEVFSSSSDPSHLRRRTNYFDDEGGVFWSAMVSAPLLLVMATQLVLFLRQSWHLMIDLKVAQLRAAAAAREKQKSGQGEATRTTTRSKTKKKKAF